ncbi:MAG: hypothetical protein NFW04_10135 [Candidatus Accumulibacter sp.]|uniref:hypothetical protein n=1 Tax=Accumulibacter sp. TaxID=2053492 RepID=UPI0025DE60AF|nr:hypothetical protein [Accumulibacter sp.]MCM8598998.1 hypothetical protein [Accumulibacter sp.]MCM8663157.1 hypothetical protein [Accumulibacter sp.]
MIDVRWPQHRYERRVGWTGQRLPLLPRLLARARVEDGGQGGGGSFAGGFVFRQAVRLGGADAAGRGPAFEAAVPVTPETGSAVPGERLVSHASRPAGVIDVAQVLADHARLNTGAGREEPLLAALHARSGAATAHSARALGAPPAFAASATGAPATSLGERDRGAVDSGSVAPPEIHRGLPASAGSVELSMQRAGRREIVPASGLPGGGDQPTDTAGQPPRARPDSGDGAEIAVGDARPVARPAAAEVRVARQVTAAAASAAETRTAPVREQYRPDTHPTSPAEPWVPLARGEPRPEDPPKPRGRDAGGARADAAPAGVMHADLAPVVVGARRAFDGFGTFVDGSGSLDAGTAASARRSPVTGLPSRSPVVGERLRASPELASMSSPAATAGEREQAAAGGDVSPAIDPDPHAGERGDPRLNTPDVQPERPAGLARVRRPGRPPASPTVVDRRPLAVGSPASPELSRGEERLAGAMPGIAAGAAAAIVARAALAEAALVARDEPETVSAATPAWPARRPSQGAMRRSGQTSSATAADRPGAGGVAEHFARAAPRSTLSIAAPADEGTRSPLANALAAGSRPTIDAAGPVGQTLSPGTTNSQTMLARVASTGRQSQSAIGGAARPPLAGDGAFAALRRAAGRSPVLLASEVAAPGGREAGAFVWRRLSAPLPPGAGGRSDTAARAASEAQASGLALAAGVTADAAGPSSGAPKWAERQAADADPAPAGTASTASGEVDWERLVSEVSRRIRRQLMVERERRGWKAWN